MDRAGLIFGLLIVILTLFSGCGDGASTRQSQETIEDLERRLQESEKARENIAARNPFVELSALKKEVERLQDLETEYASMQTRYLELLSQVEALKSENSKLKNDLGRR